MGHYQSARERAREADEHRRRIERNTRLLALLADMALAERKGPDALKAEIEESTAQIRELEGW